MSSIKKEKEELIEMFGIHFESTHNVPRLAARIMGVLIIEHKSGMTFENLVEYMGASKSSVSTSLNLLLKMGKITYYTLPGDRKKYFRSSPFSERFESYMKMIDYEKEIIDKMLVYRKKEEVETGDKFDYQYILAYKEHVLEMEAMLEKTITKFKEIEKNIKPDSESSINTNNEK